MLNIIIWKSWMKKVSVLYREACVSCGPLHFHFPFIFTFFIFLCLTKSKNTMQIFPHFFRHIFRILFLTSHDCENKIQKWVMFSEMSDDFIVIFSYPFYFRSPTKELIIVRKGERKLISIFLSHFSSHFFLFLLASVFLFSSS